MTLAYCNELASVAGMQVRLAGTANRTVLAPYRLLPWLKIIVLLCGIY